MNNFGMGFISKIFNFNNIGKKIKNFTKWACWITIFLVWVSAAFSFLILVANERTAYLCWIPIVAAVFGPIYIWISCWCIYAFGELVDKKSSDVNDDREEKRESNAHTETNSKTTYSYNIIDSNGLITDNETEETEENLEEYVEIECPNCKETISVLADESEVVCPRCKARYHIEW